MVRDEADVIGKTVAAMLRQVDLIVVADNLSSDATPEILYGLAASNPGRLVVRLDDDPAYYQGRKMSALAEYARVEHGADWVVPFDADEIWLPRTRGRIGDALDELPSAALVADAQVFNHYATADGLGWRGAAALPLRKVAARAVPGLEIATGNHSATFPGDAVALVAQDLIEVRHFPYRTPEQFVRKIRNGSQALAATDLPEHVGKHWRDYGRTLDDGGDAALVEHFRRWWLIDDPANHDDPPLVFDPCPGFG